MGKPREQRAKEHMMRRIVGGSVARAEAENRRVDWTGTCRVCGHTTTAKLEALSKGCPVCKPGDAGDKNKEPADATRNSCPEPESTSSP
jgi:rubrerythrin